MVATALPEKRSSSVKRTTTAAIAGAVLVGALGLAACSFALSRHPVGNPSVPRPTKSVNLNQYLGRWYEIARYEQSFQKGCEGVTADYELRADGDIHVVNRCRRSGGKTSEARGRAKIVDHATNAKLRVSFFGPFYGDYWVIEHADEYSWSIVGEPSGRYLWLLAREATPPAAEVDKLIERAKSLGYDTSMLLLTRHP